MKKIFIGAFILQQIAVLAQNNDYRSRVGINTTTPKATLDVMAPADRTATQPQGVLLPRLTTAEINQFQNPEPGTIVYNTDSKCVYLNTGTLSTPNWNCFIDYGTNTGGTQQDYTVTPAGFTGAYTTGATLTAANTVKFTFTNNTFYPLTNINFSDAVTATLPGSTITVDGSANSSVTVNSGSSVTLTYTLSGVLQQAGTLTANFNKLGYSATQSVQVGSSGANVTSPVSNYVVSVYPGYQGKINNTTNKLTIQIPYTQGSGSYSAVTSPVVSTAAGENSDVNGLSLSIPAGTYAGSGTINATVVVDGDAEYLVKRMSGGQQYLIATIPYTVNGNTYKVQIFGTGGDVIADGYLYMVIKDQFGTEWLNNNVNAEYARIASPLFNPTKVAAANDSNAFGSYYKFGVNPCPAGFRVPNNYEVNRLSNLPAAGRYEAAGSYTRVGTYYWSSVETADKEYGYMRGAALGYEVKGVQTPIRCIKN